MSAAAELTEHPDDLLNAGHYIVDSETGERTEAQMTRRSVIKCIVECRDLGRQAATDEDRQKWQIQLAGYEGVLRRNSVFRYASLSE